MYTNRIINGTLLGAILLSYLLFGITTVILKSQDPIQYKRLVKVQVH